MDLLAFNEICVDWEGNGSVSLVFVFWTTKMYFNQ